MGRETGRDASMTIKKIGSSDWVAQATRLYRSATSRPKRRRTPAGSGVTSLQKVSLELPPGRLPGGTGKLPVPPRSCLAPLLNAARTAQLAVPALLVAGLLAGCLHGRPGN